MLVTTTSVVALGCAHGRADSALPQDTVAIREILRDALIQEAPAFTSEIRDIDVASLRVQREESQAMPGAVYYWTAYSPRRTGDVLITAVAASVGDSAIVLRNSTDWQHLARTWKWTPVHSLVLRGCEELVRTTSRFRSFVWPPVLFREPTQLLDQSIIGSAMLQTRLVPPRISRTDPGWSVRAWFLESGRTTLYECSFGGAEQARYREVEVLPRVGFPRIGP